MAEKESKESEKEEEKKESKKDRMDEMREKLEEMYGMSSGPEGQPRPGGMGAQALLSRMGSMRGGPQGARGGQQSKAMMKSLQKLRGDMEEIKEYLRKILETLESQE